MSLKNFHLVFLLFAIMGADLFGGWAFRAYREGGDLMTLWLGVVSIVGGLGLAGYVLWFVQKVRSAHLE